MGDGLGDGWVTAWVTILVTAWVMTWVMAWVMAQRDGLGDGLGDAREAPTCRSSMSQSYGGAQYLPTPKQKPRWPSSPWDPSTDGRSSRISQ